MPTNLNLLVDNLCKVVRILFGSISIVKCLTKCPVNIYIAYIEYYVGLWMVGTSNCDISTIEKTTLLRESVELWQEISYMPFALTSSFPPSRYSVILIYLQSFCLGNMQRDFRILRNPNYECRVFDLFFFWSLFFLIHCSSYWFRVFECQKMSSLTQTIRRVIGVDYFYSSCSAVSCTYRYV